MDPSSNGDNTDTPIVWRDLMVQKAVQQLLFDVDWSKDGQGLDVLVIDMPPGIVTDSQLMVRCIVSWLITLSISLACYPIHRCCDSFNTPRCCSVGCEKKHCNVEISVCSGTTWLLLAQACSLNWVTSTKLRLQDLFSISLVNHQVNAKAQSFPTLNPSRSTYYSTTTLAQAFCFN
jgi:hypothetical protein